MTSTSRSGKNISFGSDSAHIVSDDEKAGFIDYINTLLKDDPELQEQKLVPLNPNSDEIYTAVESGLLLAYASHSQYRVTGNLDLLVLHSTRGPTLL